MQFLILLLVIIIAALLIFIIRMKNDIKYINNQIKTSGYKYQNIKMKTKKRNLEKLVISINELYDIQQKSLVQLKHMEEELRCSIANMCHDLRTPLTSITGYIQLISEDSNLTKQQRYEYMDIVKKRTARLQDLITNFYELSRVEAGDLKIDLKSINLKDILCEIIALSYNDFTKNNINPVINIDEGNFNIISDEKSVIRIFSNLISNIIKHGEKNVIITLTVKDNYILSEFSNNTSNLKNEDIKYLFDRTFTADTTRSSENTGLGLSITKSLVIQLGHDITADLSNNILKISIIWRKLHPNLDNMK